MSTQTLFTALGNSVVFLKKQIGSSLKVNSLTGLGWKLANMGDLKHKRFKDGMKYLVKKR